MSDINALKKELTRIDGKGYGAYKDIRGRYNLGGCELFIDHVQSDPFAPPSKIRLRISQKRAAFPEEFFKNRIRKTALEDYLSRAFIREINREKDKNLRIEMDVCGQEVLERSSMQVHSEQVEARLAVGLPAKGRRIMGRQAADLLCRELPLLAERAMIYASLDAEKIKGTCKQSRTRNTCVPVCGKKGS